MPGRFEEFARLLAGGAGAVYPGAVAGCWRGHDELHLGAVGATAYAGHGVQVAGVGPDTVFDVASLTKPLATVPVLLSLAGEGRLDLDAPIGGPLAVFRGTPFATVTPIRLMAHVSGLPAWRPFASDLVASRGEVVAGTGEAREAVLRRIAAEAPEAPAGTACTYSDLGYIVLATLAEAAGQAPLDRLFADRVAAPLGLRRTFFVRVRAGAIVSRPVPPGEFAATEVCPTRRRCLQGEVHDDNAWVLGGVAGHAGLFSTAREVAEIALAFLDSSRDEGFLPRDLVRRAWSREVTPPGATRLPGFDTPSPSGSMAGDRAPSGTVGHLGFTGTSFWMDPASAALVVLLSNRVHPDRSRAGIQALRPRLHDAAWRALGVARG